MVFGDAVVTDADVWDVATQRAHLDDEFGTPIFKSLTDLGDLPGPLIPAPIQARGSLGSAVVSLKRRHGHRLGGSIARRPSALAPVCQDRCRAPSAWRPSTKERRR